MSAIQHPLNTEAWAEWVEYRRLMKKKIGPRALISQPRMLQKYLPEQQRLILDYSMDNDYQGLFPDKIVPRARPVAPNSTRARTLHDDLTDRSWYYTG